jgi:hypothetical protein
LSEAPLIGKRELTHDGPVVRLLMCLVCNTIEELPPHEGPPEQDYLLEISVEKHQFPSGEPHKGKLFILPVKTWANPKHQKEIIKQLKGGGSEGLDALTPEGDYYSTKMTFADDAMECWKKHMRPGETHGCNDYESPEKRLLPKTYKERKDAGLPDPMNAPGPKIFLCHFCPFHSTVMTKKRAMRGMYD